MFKREVFYIKWIILCIFIFLMAALVIITSRGKMIINESANANYLNVEDLYTTEIIYKEDGLLTQEILKEYLDKSNAYITSYSSEINQGIFAMYYGDFPRLSVEIKEVLNKKEVFGPSFYMGSDLIENGKAYIDKDQEVIISGEIIKNPIAKNASISNIENIFSSSQISEEGFEMQKGDSLLLISDRQLEKVHELNGTTVRVNEVKVDLQGSFHMINTDNIAEGKSIKSFLVIALLFLFSIVYIQKLNYSNWNREKEIILYLGYSRKKMIIKEILIFSILVILLLIVEIISLNLVFLWTQGRFGLWNRGLMTQIIKKDHIHLILFSNFIIILSLWGIFVSRIRGITQIGKSN